MTRSNGGIIGDLNEPSSAMTATGGTVSTDGDYKIHTFTSNGNLDITSTPSASGVFDMRAQYSLKKAAKWPSGSGQLSEVLMVGGGGGGGGTSNGWSSNGSGGHAYKATDYGVSAQTYAIVVGSGGSGGSGYGYGGAVGGNTTFDSNVVQGGNGGGGNRCCPWTTFSGSSQSGGTVGSTTDITDDITGSSVTYGQNGPGPSLNSGHPSNTGSTGRGGSGSRNYGSQGGQSGRPGIFVVRYKFQ